MSGSVAPSPELSRLSATEGLRILRLDDDAVVFDPLSWDVHLLNPAAIAVLELVDEAPRSEDEIERFLSAALQPEERARADEHARRLIAELKSLGLVRPT